MTPEAQAAITAASIAFGIPEAAILSPRRTKRVVLARFAAWALVRDEGATIAEIGHEFNRDHTSILNGLRRAAEIGAESSGFSEACRFARQHFERQQSEQRMRAAPRFYRHGHFQETAT